MRAVVILGLVAAFVTATAREASAQWSQNERAVSGSAVPSAPPSVENLPYEEGKPVPPGYHVVEQREAGVEVLGGLVLGVSYGVTALAGLFLATISDALDGNSHGYALLVMPRLGPFALMAVQGHLNDGLLFCGSAQLLGIGILALGAATPPTKTLARDGFALRTAAPVAVPGGGGFLLSGTF